MNGSQKLKSQIEGLMNFLTEKIQQAMGNLQCGSMIWWRKKNCMIIFNR